MMPENSKNEKIEATNPGGELSTEESEGRSPKLKKPNLAVDDELVDFYMAEVGVRW